ncbi:MAG: ABC transporter permease [Flavobacteriales bacterium]|nr:ABC transporter permease [Flavobacteriales bacterium]
MMTLIKIAWRNIWRNTLRSSLVILSMVVGIAAGILFLGIAYGVNNKRMEASIYTHLSHIQIHNKEFRQRMESKYYIPNIENVEDQLQAIPELMAYSKRYVINGLINSPRSGSGIILKAIDTETDSLVSNLQELIIEGSYLEKKRYPPIVIGEKLAQNLQVEVNKKVTVIYRSEGQEIANRFKVAGIFRSSALGMEESTAFMRRQDYESQTGVIDQAHEIAILVTSLDVVERVKESIDAEGSAVESWTDLAPELKLMDMMLDKMIFIIMGIILLALSFGIVNTMLMVILERTRELGMLMSVGMNKAKIFLLVMVETVMLSAIGGPIGMALSSLMINHLGKTGIDLSAVGEGLKTFGIGSIIYPKLLDGDLVTIGLMVIGIGILSAIYPAIKALKLKPAEAVRAV